MAVTIKDIAKKAGVAHSTVSRALRGSPLISTETTKRVTLIANEMGYQPSAAARSLRTNRSQVLGVIVNAIDDPFFSEVLQGIDDVAQHNGYTLFIASSQQNPHREQLIARTMREHRVDGVIICSAPFNPEQSLQHQGFEIPVVVINNQSVEDYPYSIYHDDLDGSRKVMQHLIGLGHQKIAYLGYSYSGRTNLHRLAGYRALMHSADLLIPSGYEYQVDDSNPLEGQVAVRHFLSLPQCPTAIFCYNDVLAIGVLRGFHEAGYKVPDDCSVTGFDNISFSAYTFPPLTTFDQQKHNLGEQATQMVMKLIDHPKDELISGPMIHTLQGSLIVRGSTAKPNG
jgi:DNA-binding LacI/PurR family transcriptional regulator